MLAGAAFALVCAKIAEFLLLWAPFRGTMGQPCFLVHVESLPFPKHNLPGLRVIGISAGAGCRKYWPRIKRDHMLGAYAVLQWPKQCVLCCMDPVQGVETAAIRRVAPESFFAKPASAQHCAGWQSKWHALQFQQVLIF